VAYDVFISFKNFDESGVLTRDAELAKEVYDFLTVKGLNVFISTVTLEDLGVSDYKKAIDDALDTASIVVAVGTSSKNLNSKWVRYEWDSFFADVLSGVKPGDRVFAYVEGVLPAQLPRTLRQTQTFIHCSEALQQLYSFVVQALRQDQPNAAHMQLPVEPVLHIEANVTTAPMRPPRVFVSYASEDEPYATALSEVIIQAGFEVVTGKDQRFFGADWGASIEREIRNCAFFVPNISENTERTIEGDFFREWSEASERSSHMDRDRPFIVPVKAGKLDAPTHIPETFQRINWIYMEEPTVPRPFVEFFQKHAREVA
jgi:hypothetical protein